MSCDSAARRGLPEATAEAAGREQSPQHFRPARRSLRRGRCCKRFAHRASPLSLYASTACEDGFPSSQWIDLEDSILFWVHFQHTPTHRGSLAELAKSLASYVSGSRSRYVARGGTLCKEKSCRECRCGPLSCWDYPHTIAPCGAWELDSSGRTSTAAPATTC